VARREVERRRRRGGLVALGAALAAWGGFGCSNFDNGPAICSRPATEKPLPYAGGTVEGDWYMSADWDGEWLAFPGGAYYEIDHGLGVMPRVLMFYLSFERFGLPDGRSFSLAAGNEVQVEAVSEESVVVMNGTCSDFWLLAVIGAGDDLPTP